MKIEIEIDESYIAELVSQEIAKRIVTEHCYENREARIGIREGVDKAINWIDWGKCGISVKKLYPQKGNTSTQKKIQ